MTSFSLLLSGITPYYRNIRQIHLDRLPSPTAHILGKPPIIGLSNTTIATPGKRQPVTNATGITPVGEQVGIRKDKLCDRPKTTGMNGKQAGRKKNGNNGNASISELNQETDGRILLLSHVGRVGIPKSPGNRKPNWAAIRGRGRQLIRPMKNEGAFDIRQLQEVFLTLCDSLERLMNYHIPSLTKHEKAQKSPTFLKEGQWRSPRVPL